MAHVKEEGYSVGVVRSDNGGELKGGVFGALFRDRGIKQEITTPDSPEFKGVVDRAISLVESVARAARCQAPILLPGVSLPDTARLWEKSIEWAVDSLNRTSTLPIQTTSRLTRCITDM